MPLLETTPVQRTARRLALASWIALIVLGIAWEMWLAPLRPGGSWLVLKVVPLVVMLPALRRGRVDAMQVALFVVMLCLFEGSARLLERMPGALLAAVETALALLFLGAAIVYLRPFKIAARRTRSSS